MTTTFHWQREDGDEVAIEVEFECAAYHPARTWGRPEDCYPAEGGEIESIEFSCDDPDALREFTEAYKVDRRLQDRVDEACYEAHHTLGRFYARSFN